MRLERNGTQRSAVLLSMYPVLINKIKCTGPLSGNPGDFGVEPSARIEPHLQVCFHVKRPRPSRLRNAPRRTHFALHRRNLPCAALVSQTHAPRSTAPLVRHTQYRQRPCLSTATSTVRIPPDGPARYTLHTSHCSQLFLFSQRHPD